MIRDLSVGNGQLLINFDDRYQICGLYFPPFGQGNQVKAGNCKLGLAGENKLAWTTDDSWRIRARYLKETLTSSVSLANNHIQAVCACTDAADVDHPIIVRRIKVRNLVDYPRTISVLHLQEALPGRSRPQFACYNDPQLKGLIHNVTDRYILMGFSRDGSGVDVTAAVGGQISRALTWLDRDVADLSNRADHESGADSVGLIKVDLELAGFQEDQVYMVITLARNLGELAAQVEYLKNTGLETIIDRSCAYWRLWSTGTNINFGNLSARVVDLFKRSLLTIRAHSNAGGIMANDAEEDSSADRCEPSYRHPVLMSLLAHAMDLAGLPEPARWLYRHCRRLLTRVPAGRDSNDSPSGQAHTDPQDTSDDSRFHPAGFAAVIWSLWRHYFRYRDVEYLRRLWPTLVRPGADFICDAYDDHLELPPPGRDLWDRGLGLDAFALAALYGGLVSARNFAICFGDRRRVDRYGRMAENLKLSTERRLYDGRAGRFGSILWLTDAGQHALDNRLDAAVFALTKFGMFDPSDDRMVSAATALCDELWVNTPIGGLTRFHGDYGGTPAPDRAAGIPGRPAVAPTLWLAQYLIARAENVNELKQALPILEWAVTNAAPTGLLATSLDPTTGFDRCGSPDLWAHAEFVIAVINYLEKLEQLKICTSCGQSVYRLRRHWPMQVKLDDLLAKYGEREQVEALRTDGLVVFEHEGKEITLAIDSRECIGCGVCCINCDRGVLVMIDDKAKADVSNLNRCNLCMDCRNSCPVNAIEIRHSSSKVYSR